MMRLNNDSLTSIGSNKDKKLPPIPNSQENEAETTNIIPNDDLILQSKTLKRKNFKKLSLDSPSTTSTPSASQPENTSIDMGLRYPPSSKAGRIRPAPLMNLNRNSQGKLNINQSNRNMDPDTQSSTDVIMNHFSNLELSNMNKRNPSIANRKRQTVISSISPTKSSASSPNDANLNSLNLADQQSPIATTSSIKLNNNDLLTLKNLGSGNSGTVSKILHIPTQKTMAKKIIHIDLKSVIQTQIIRELRILHECQSPFIIEFYGAFINNNNTIVICMEYCNCGSLDKILPLCQNNQFPLFVLKKLSHAILSGLTYLYSTHKIIHRDIKPSNVLMNHKGEFKLCDFGVLRELTNSLAMADTFVGTSTYMSPERIQGLTYGVKSDVWSMGLMLIELARGIPVWVDDGEEEGPQGPEGILDLLQRIVNEAPPSLANKINTATNQPFDDLLCKFIDSCLIKDDNLRKSPWDLLNEPQGFLAGVEKGLYDKDVKMWAKGIRKLHKEKNES
ncbi:unnamed protein product [Debaryomyces tyrocola]|nr:unnamed protein product [Debaryomyces tyrocola]